MSRYEFTRNWFRTEDLKNYLPVGTSQEIHMLEIGSFEGRSTVWFLENILQNKNSHITCIDPWMNYFQNENSLNSYNIETETQTGVDYIKDEIKKRFVNNINNTGQSNKVNIIHGYSNQELPKLINNSIEYDYIFIDGNHVAPSVLTDAVMGWYLLKKNGLLIFDDYKWGRKNNCNPSLSPKLAIDCFTQCFKDYLKVIWTDYRYVVKKVK